jgi:hypothetical protein
MEAQPAPRSRMPRIVVIESTALFQLGSLFEHVDFAELLELRKYVKFEIVVSQVSWLEFLRQRKTQVSECIGKVQQLRSSLEKLGQDPSALNDIDDRLGDLNKNFASVYEKKLSDLGIRILPLAKCDVERLLQMSIGNVPPFEHSHEKGFRDSLIMFSILEEIKGRPDLNAFIISEDKLFTKGILAKQSEYGTVVNVVEDIEKVNIHIAGLIGEVLRVRRSKEKQEARELLLKYRTAIERAVQNIREFSIFEIPNTLFGGTVERILSCEFNDVNSATWKTRTENSATILFSLKCTLTALVGPPLWEFVNRTRYQVGGGSTMLTPTNQDPKETKMEKIVFGVAEFTKKNGDLDLVRLRVDQSLPTEDLAQLMTTD